MTETYNSLLKPHKGLLHLVAGRVWIALSLTQKVGTNTCPPGKMLRVAPVGPRTCGNNRSLRVVDRMNSAMLLTHLLNLWEPNYISVPPSTSIAYRTNMHFKTTLVRPSEAWLFSLHPPIMRVLWHLISHACIPKDTAATLDYESDPVLWCLLYIQHGSLFLPDCTRLTTSKLKATPLRQINKLNT